MEVYKIYSDTLDFRVFCTETNSSTLWCGRGGPGGLGRNTWVKQLREEDGDLDEQSDMRTREINIGGKASVWMGKGDRLVIETPGGGAWGVDENAMHGKRDPHGHVPAWEPRGSFAERAAAQASF